MIRVFHWLWKQHEFRDVPGECSVVSGLAQLWLATTHRRTRHWLCLPRTCGESTAFDVEDCTYLPQQYVHGYNDREKPAHEKCLSWHAAILQGQIWRRLPGMISCSRLPGIYCNWYFFVLSVASLCPDTNVNCKMRTYSIVVTTSRQLNADPNTGTCAVCR